jgi:hypothetical protein
MLVDTSDESISVTAQVLMLNCSIASLERRYVGEKARYWIQLTFHALPLSAPSSQVSPPGAPFSLSCSE